MRCCSYLLSLHVPSSDVDTHSPVGKVAVQLLGSEQGTTPQHAALQKAPGKYTLEGKISTSKSNRLAFQDAVEEKSKDVVSDVTSIFKSKKSNPHQALRLQTNTHFLLLLLSKTVLNKHLL